jgi:hypothetical protein
VVNLERNRLKVISGGAFVGAKCLRWLNLAENGLEEVAVDAFKGLGLTLQELDMSGNGFGIVDFSMFLELVGSLQLLSVDCVGCAFQGKLSAKLADFFKRVQVRTKIIRYN